MTTEEIPASDDVVDVLRVRLYDADALDSSKLHDFSELLADYAGRIPERWYWELFEELEAQGHLYPGSSKLNGGDACARLSADARAYLRETGERP